MGAHSVRDKQRDLQMDKTLQKGKGVRGEQERGRADRPTEGRLEERTRNAVDAERQGEQGS